MNFLIALLVGLAAGTHVATWGMYKDAIHEGFTVRRYARSIVVGALAGLAVERFVQFDLTRASSIVVLFGLVYAVERGIVEVWKTFLRDEDQSKYFIPMQFAVGGRPVKSRGARLAAGAAYVAAVVAIVGGLWALDRTRPLPHWALLLVAGSAWGWVAAVGGAWKDAPKEGFEFFKFFRSPIMTLAFALLLSFLTDSYFYIAIGALGYERAAVETYKTFFFPNKPRGKFAGMPITHPEMLTRRQRFIPLYAAIWLGVIAAYVMAIREPKIKQLRAATCDPSLRSGQALRPQCARDVRSLPSALRSQHAARSTQPS